MIIDTADRLKTTQEYYFSVKLQEVRELMAKGRDIINIAIGNPDMMPSQATIDELSKQANKPENHGYQAYRSIPELRKSIAAWMENTYGVHLNAETEILPLIGSKEGITHISLAFLNPGDEVLVPELAYPSYGVVAEMVGGKARSYPMIENENYRPDIEAIEKQNLDKVKLIWINYPNMPTGARADIKVFEELVAFAQKHNILICHDNPYSLILNEGKPLSLLSVPGASEVALELNSMSKSHNMAGWRIGWIAGAKDYIDAIVKIKSNVDSGMFKPMQLAAVEAFKNPQSWHDARNEEYKKRRDLIYQLLDKLNCTYDKSQTGMFIWAKVDAALDSSKRLADYLLYEKDIFVTPGMVYGEKGNRYIRVSLCVKQELLQRVLERIEGFKLTAL